MQEGTYLETLQEIQANEHTDPRDVATCGTCGFSWDDSVPTSLTPAPAGRCPNEYNHEYDDGDTLIAGVVYGPDGYEVDVDNDEYELTTAEHDTYREQVDPGA